MAVGKFHNARDRDLVRIDGPPPASYPRMSSDIKSREWLQGHLQARENSAARSEGRAPERIYVANAPPKTEVVYRDRIREVEKVIERIVERPVRLTDARPAFWTPSRKYEAWICVISFAFWLQTALP